MSTEIVSDADATEPLLRRKTLTGFTQATMRTDIDCGEYGQLITDEPASHRGDRSGTFAAADGPRGSRGL